MLVCVLMPTGYDDMLSPSRRCFVSFFSRTQDLLCGTCQSKSKVMSEAIGSLVLRRECKSSLIDLLWYFFVRYEVQADLMK